MIVKLWFEDEISYKVKKIKKNSWFLTTNYFTNYANLKSDSYLT